jgi:hypothetical protein
MNKTLFTTGLLLVCLAAALLLVNVLPSGGAAAIAVLGIGLVTVALGKKAKPGSAPVAQVVERVYSSDRQQMAVVKQRVDGKYQVELFKLVTDPLPEIGSQWARQSAMGMTDTLSAAVDIAGSYVRPGEKSFGDED